MTSTKTRCQQNPEMLHRFKSNTTVPVMAWSTTSECVPMASSKTYLSIRSQPPPKQSNGQGGGRIVCWCDRFRELVGKAQLARAQALCAVTQFANTPQSRLQPVWASQERSARLRTPDISLLSSPCLRSCASHKHKSYPQFVNLSALIAGRKTQAWGNHLANGGGCRKQLTN